MQNRSVYHMARKSIETGIMQLQQKMRKRKQMRLDLELDQNIIKTDKLNQYDYELNQLMRVYGDIKTQNMYLGRQPLQSRNVNNGHCRVASFNPLIYKNTIESLNYDTIAYDPNAWTNGDLSDRIKKETLSLQYMRKIEQLKRQEDLRAQKEYFRKQIEIKEALSEEKLSLKKQLQKEEYLTKQKILQQELQNVEDQKRYHQAIGNYGHLIRSGCRASPERTLLENTNAETYLARQSSYIKNTPLQSTLLHTGLYYDQPFVEENSSVLVEKYSRGIKAEQYYRDIQRLQYLQEKFKQQARMSFRRPMKIKFESHASSPIKQSQKRHQEHDKHLRTPQNLSSSQKRQSPYQSKTKEKLRMPIDIIKEDNQQGTETVTNTVGNSRQRKDQQKKPLQPVTKAFVNTKLKDIIEGQKKDSRRKNGCSQSRKKYDRPFSAEKILSSANSKNLDSSRLNYRQNYGKALNASILGRSQHNSSGLRESEKNKKQKLYLSKVHQRIIREKQQQKKHKSLYGKDKKSKSYSTTVRNHSSSRKSNRQNKSKQIYVAAPLGGSAGQTIDFPETIMQKIKNSCNEKIENRLRVSSVIHKDSKLRNNKHEMDHLLSKFGNQKKVRKQVKEKINSNPRIMRKHKMVIQ